METRSFTSEEIKLLKISSIAWKHRCSEDYVRKVLKNVRDRNSDLTQKIVKDAEDMLGIINRETVLEGGE